MNYMLNKIEFNPDNSGWENRYFTVGSPAGSLPFARYRAPQSAHQLPARIDKPPAFWASPHHPEKLLPRYRRAGIFLWQCPKRRQFLVDIKNIANQSIKNNLRVPPSKEPMKNPPSPNLCTVDQARTSSPDSTVFDIGERSIIHLRNGNFAKLR